MQAFSFGLAQAGVTVSQSSAVSFQNDPVTLTATVTGTDPLFPGTPTGQVRFTVDGNPIGSPVPLDASGHASLTTTELPPGTHQIRAVYLGDADYAQVTSASIDHLTKGAFEQLADLSAAVAGLNPSFGNAVDNATKHLEMGMTDQTCKELSDFDKKVEKEKGLPAVQAAALLAATARLETLLGC